MSDHHADTIRDRHAVGVVVTDSPGLGYGDYVLITESERDALLAENQRQAEDIASLHLELEAEKHNHKKDNEYLLNEIRCLKAGMS